MAVEDSFRGFDHDFLIDDTVKEKVPFPKLGPSHKKDIAPVEGSKESILNYHNYSVQLSASRKFPFLLLLILMAVCLKMQIELKAGRKIKGQKNINGALNYIKQPKVILTKDT